MSTEPQTIQPVKSQYSQDKYEEGNKIKALQRKNSRKDKKEKKAIKRGKKKGGEMEGEKRKGQKERVLSDEKKLERSSVDSKTKGQKKR